MKKLSKIQLVVAATFSAAFSNVALSQPGEGDNEIQDAFDMLGDFYPSIELSYTSHDNVRRRPNADEEDTVLRIKPSLEYGTKIGRHGLYLSVGADSKTHGDYESEDADALKVRGAVNLDVSKRIDVDLFASTEDTYEERGVSGTTGFVQAEDGPEEVDIDSFGAEIKYGHYISPLNVVVGYESSSIGYERTAAGDQERDIDEVRLDASYDLSATTAAFVRYTQTDIDYLTGTLDSDQSTAMVGLRFRPGGKVNGAFGIGTTDKNFSDEAREDYSGSTHYANIAYQLKPYSTVSLNASRKVEEPGEDNSDYYVTDLIGASWDHSLTDRLSVGVYTKTFEDDYNNGRVDEFNDSGLNVKYAFKDWLTVGLTYGSVERDSNRENNSYEDNYVGVSLKSSLR